MLQSHKEYENALQYKAFVKLVTRGPCWKSFILLMKKRYNVKTIKFSNSYNARIDECYSRVYVVCADLRKYHLEKVKPQVIIIVES